ncbi:MAG: hypothetical protein RLZZ127_1431 [Planctomycetota bacterium]|jgi:predicted dehydrogenase
MTSSIRCAIIGVGRAIGDTGTKGGGHRIGWTHAGMFTRNPATALVAAADIDAGNLAGFRDRFPCAGYADHRAMLAAERPDIVSLCTYVGLHEGMIADCARAGVRGIVCEKPYLPSPAAVARIDAIVRDTGIRIVTAHMRRHRPAFVRAAALYQGGAVGVPVMACAGIAGWDLAEWGSHWLDLFRQVHGDREPAWVMGQARRRGARGYGHAMEDHAVAAVGWADGSHALLDGGMAMAGDATMTLAGSAGMIRLVGEERVDIIDHHGLRSELFSGAMPVGWERLGLPEPPADHRGRSWDGLWDMLLGDLLAWMDGGPEPALGHGRSRGTCLLMLAAYLSARLGDRIDLPLAEALLAVDGWPLEDAPPGLPEG